MSSTTDSHKPPKPKPGASSLPTHASRPRRSTPSQSQSLDEESRRLKSKYSSSLSTLGELFPDWKDEDLLTVLADTEGNLEEAVVRITEGKYFYPIFFSFPFSLSTLVVMANFHSFFACPIPQCKTDDFVGVLSLVAWLRLDNSTYSMNYFHFLMD